MIDSHGSCMGSTPDCLQEVLPESVLSASRFLRFTLLAQALGICTVANLPLKLTAGLFVGLRIISPAVEVRTVKLRDSFPVHRVFSHRCCLGLMKIEAIFSLLRLYMRKPDLKANNTLDNRHEIHIFFGLSLPTCSCCTLSTSRAGTRFHAASSCKVNSHSKLYCAINHMPKCFILSS